LRHDDQPKDKDTKEMSNDAGISVEIKSMPDCKFCTSAKEWLASRGIRYVETSIPNADDRQAIYDSLGLVGGKRTMPQIFCTDSESGETFRVGGFDDLQVSGLG
jgi:glutaredoxin